MGPPNRGVQWENGWAVPKHSKEMWATGSDLGGRIEMADDLLRLSKKGT